MPSRIEWVDGAAIEMRPRSQTGNF